ncbi:MarR family winged helix-turn-helix transcriptional regulator [Pseudonocardia sp. WMMC193]|uniref:MarR family winged helix-turn-helix transcriptional regulator n=1 Tax=Pseudonocardia sp. WMMC193 TaxID=2911965 RepID=UPI001F233B24|nr:MarR family transcriptional regulator [Pseudonocardia sp. WMMC193]MCF7552502.1 MarR family transcriptional regulator [Pseudonocardia sp. WMMC193]
MNEEAAQSVERADELGTQLARLIRLFDRMQAQYQAENPNAVERSAYLLLVHLVKDGPQRPGALAEAVRSDPSTVSRQIAQLGRLGYVARTPDPEDGRASLIAATEEGRRVFEENRQQRNTRIAALLADWTPEDQAMLTRLLGRFSTALEETWSKGD